MTPRFLEAMWQDVRFSLRALRSHRVFSVVALFTLALGIGANTAIYSFVHNIVLKPLPYPEPDRILSINGFSSPANFTDLIREGRQVSAVAAYNGFTRYLTEDATAQLVTGANVSPRFLEVLGVTPQLGRDFQDADDVEGANQVAIVSDRLWRTQFGADSSLVNSTIRINDEPVTVIGIAPAIIDAPFDRDLYMPFQWSDATRATRNSRFINVYARVAPGSTAEAATAEIEALHERIKAEYPDIEGRFTASVRTLKESLIRNDRQLLLTLGGASLLVLLLACANVSHLLLARSETRGMELAMRAALGGVRGRLVRQLLTESLVLGLIGGILGAALAVLGTRGLLALFGTSLPRSAEVAVEGPVLLFALATSILTGIAIGIIPAIRYGRVEPSQELRKEGSRSGGGRSAARTTIMVAEVALALVLVSGAGLFLRSFLEVSNVDPGFETAGVLTVQVQLPTYRYTDLIERRALYTDLENRLTSDARILSAGVTNKLPLTAGRNNVTKIIPDEDTSIEANWVELRYVSAGFFDALGIPLVSGRHLVSTDRVDDPPEDFSTLEVPVVINQRLAEFLFPGQDALGRVIRSDQLGNAGLRVAGVVGSVREFAADEEIPYALYFHHYVGGSAWMYVTVQTEGDPMSAVEPIQSALAEIDPAIPIGSIRTLEDVRSASIGDRTLAVYLMGSFASLALILSAIGIYGVTAYNAVQRTREVGIRMALGAEGSQVARMMVTQGASLAAIGIAIGLVGAIALRSLVEGLLYQVSPSDPFTLGAVSVVLAGVVLLACYIPARRASSVQPVEALRHD